MKFATRDSSSTSRIRTALYFLSLTCASVTDMAFVAALVIGLLALAIAPGYAFYFDVTPKAAVLLAGTAGMLILAARGGESPGGPRLFAVLLLLNAVSLAVSTVWSTNRALSLYGGSWRCFGAPMQGVAMLFAWLVAWKSAERPERARVVLRGVTISAVPAAALGVWRPPGTLGDARSEEHTSEL